jgi:branched-chain amino acid transport system permease protein
MNLTFQSGEPFYYIFLFLAIGIVYLTHRIRYSALGYHLKATASNDDAAKALGVNTSLTQIIALMWSSGITGVLGVFYVFYVYSLEPQTFFSLDLFSLQPALNGIIGGMGTVWGPILGAILMTPLGEFLRYYLGTVQQGLNFVVYGLVLVLTVRFIPGGIISLILPTIKRKQIKEKTKGHSNEGEV